MNLDLLQSISVQVDRYGVEITPHVKYRIKVQIDCLDGKNIQIESEINLDERQRNVQYSHERTKFKYPSKLFKSFH